MKNLLKFGFLLFFLVFGAISCDKEGSDSSTDQIENNSDKVFFEIGYIENANPHVLESLKTRNKKIKPDKLHKIFQKRKQLREEVEAIGYISWENLILYRGNEEDDDAIILVPILTETSELCTGFAFISYLPEDHARYRIVSRSDIPSIPWKKDLSNGEIFSKEWAILSISLCDTEIFGGGDCVLIESLPSTQSENSTKSRSELCIVGYEYECFCPNGGYAFNGSTSCQGMYCEYTHPVYAICSGSTSGGSTGGGSTGGTTYPGTGGSSGSGGLTGPQIELINEYLEANTQIKSIYNNFLAKYPSNQAALDHARFQVLNIMADSDYKRLVTSSVGFSSVMWQIAKELIGDKAVDIIIGLIPAFGNADELKDAIKAAKNGDWFEFTFEVGKIIGQNTPWGKMLKIADAGSEMYQFCKKIDRIWDKIGTWSSTRATRAWEIIKKSIKSPIATNPEYWKYVDDLASPRFGSYFATFNNYAEKFRTKWDIPQGEIWVHHAVERQAMTVRYPNLGLTESELNSLENLRGIPANINNEVHLSAIRNRWNAFYSNNPASTITKQKLLDQAKLIDQEFGHLFNPPIR